LNAGKLEDYLVTVVDWLLANPYDVVTILIGNAGLIAPGNYTAPIEASGLIEFVFAPPKITMALEDWPPLSHFILSGHRVIVFMDYMANQTEIPYLLDEFTYMWETPFSPTNRSFPCTVQRPQGLAESDARTLMYIANHNLNTELKLGAISILVPNMVLLNVTNAASGFGSAGAMSRDCTGVYHSGSSKALPELT
jgi:hypothetical protein